MCTMNTRREFLTTVGVGLVGTRLAGAQQSAGQANAAPPVRTVKTTPLFKSPEGYPNGIAATPEGLWIAEQKSDVAHLVDWNGKPLKAVKTESKNTSGLGFGDGCIWMAANAAPQGIFQTDLSAKTISHRQIPLGPGENGGGCHGVEYVNGKLWIAALRLRSILRVDAKTWQPEFMIPYSVPRAHGIAWDAREGGAIWMVTGDERGAGLIKYDASTGRMLETARFADADCDPHGLAWHNGVLYSCDAGIHPGWTENKSPTHGYIFKIDLI
jgi:streptogramin lyase